MREHAIMYDNLLDRARIIQILFKAWRLAQKSKQAELASVSKVRQSVISNIENLSSSIKDKKRQVTRDDLINTTIALTEDKEKLDLLLWLFDGNFLDEKEVLKFALKEEGLKKSDHRKKPREAVLEFLKEALGIYEENAEKDYQGEVIGYRSSNKEFKDKVGEELLKMEMVEGVRLLVRPLPSYIILKNLDLDKSGEIAIKERPYEIGMERVDLFFSRINEFGIRNIHDKNSIHLYLNDEKLNHKLKGERKVQIKVLIRLLERYDKYQVRLAEDNPTPFSFQVAALNTVVLSPPELMGKEVKEKYKYSYLKRIKLTGEENVLPFIIEFETIWNRLSVQQSSNAEVVKILKKMIE